MEKTINDLETFKNNSYGKHKYDGYFLIICCMRYNIVNICIEPRIIFQNVHFEKMAQRKQYENHWSNCC